MAAPIKDKADWYKHDRDFRNSRQIKAIKTKFKLTGYAIAVMLREALTGSSNFEMPFANEFDEEICAGDFDIEAAELREIISYMEKVGYVKFTSERNIYCPDLTETLTGLLEKRESDRQRKQTKSFPRGNSVQHGVFQPENAQREERDKRREEESKEEQSKGETADIFCDDNFQVEVKEEREPDFGGEQILSIRTQHESEAKPKASRKEPEPIALPHGPGFAAAWAEWLAYRKEKGAKMTPRTIKSQLETLSKLSEKAAIETINQSIRNGWQGIFELKGAANPEKPKMKNGQWFDPVTGLRRMILQ